PNRKPFWPDRDHDSGLRPGRSSQETKALDHLERGARADDRGDHFKFFARRYRYSRRRQRSLARCFLAPPTFAVANRARRFVFAPASHGAAPLWRTNARTISSPQSRQCGAFERFPVADFFRRLSADKGLAL